MFTSFQLFVFIFLSRVVLSKQLRDQKNVWTKITWKVGGGIDQFWGKERWFNKVFWENEHRFDKVLWEDECDYFEKINVDLTKHSEILGVDKQTILTKQVGRLAKNLSDPGWD